MRKKIIIGVIVVLVLGLGFFSWNKFINPKATSTNKKLLQRKVNSNMIMTLKKGNLEKIISINGIVKPIQSQELYFKTNGTINSINIEEGAQVKKGQILMKIDDDQQRLNYLKAKANYEKAVINGTPSEIKKARLNLEIAKDKLEETKLKAPFTGIINKINIEEGSYTAQNQGKTVAKLIDNSSYQVEVSVDESESQQLELGQPARITMEALPNQELRGKVIDIGANATNTSGVITLPVTVSIINKPQFIKPGFSADVEIIVKQVKNKLLVPITAIYNQEGQTKAVKAVNGKPKPIKVKTGISNGKKIIIKEGLQAGDKIVINTYKFANTGENQGPRGMIRGGGR
ncbi:RND family efflux transporter, MFP subunit [Halobacteroides halobius DSM 5150]|uniref:RND family efflux transporter, MFP subunit n=1 Tax=Halobacteroides halobius (strain ATCC 35273 / DSM 5150 / MD-1) TaxID=748449 RepID=L0K8I7_HALHC|nr:efflux RND transporter periplasmic adaptor subunit [Halobacteroides halobius]AGB41306.1 RND family efflux transporter, MFP subunit [Halobacteroides halobius DSM 5150]